MLEKEVDIAWLAMKAAVLQYLMSDSRVRGVHIFSLCLFVIILPLFYVMICLS